MDDTDHRKNGIAFFLIVLVIALAIGGAYLAKYAGGHTVSYQQTSQASQTSQGAGTATSSPLTLASISPSSAAVNSVVTISGQGFSLTPSTAPSTLPSVSPSVSGSSADSVIVWLTPENVPSASSTTSTNFGGYGMATTSALPAAGVLWQGNPDSTEDTGFNFGVNRFLCAEPNPNGQSSDLSSCSAIFPVADGVYGMTVSIPALGLTSDSQLLTITSPSLSTKNYTDPTNGYSLNYPDDMTVKEDASYPPAPSATVAATVFTFPKTYFPESTLSQASIAIAVTNGNCNLWADGVQSFAVAATTTFAGTGATQWQERIDNNAGAGNFYSTIEYSTAVGSQCYRVALFSHLADPGVYSDDNSQILSYSIANAAAQEMLDSAFNQVMQSFKL